MFDVETMSSKVASFVFIWFLLALPGMGQGHSVSYENVKIGKIKVDVITADLRSGRVSFDLYVASHHPSNHSFPHEAFETMILKTQPTAAINGTYYDTRTFIPVGTLVSDGQMLQTGTHGTAVCIDKNNQVGFYKIRDLRNFPWAQFEVVLSTGPTLVENGQIHLYPRQEHFRDPEIFRPARRSALGITRDKKLLLICVKKPIRLRSMAWIMKKLGAVRAVSLDGGSASALYYRGNYVIRPSRLLTNILLVHEQKEAALFKE